MIGLFGKNYAGFSNARTTSGIQQLEKYLGVLGFDETSGPQILAYVLIRSHDVMRIILDECGDRLMNVAWKSKWD